MPSEKKSSDVSIAQFKDKMRTTLGSVIRKPFSAKLGYVDSAGVVHIQVASTDSNQPKQYYFSSFDGQSNVGQAYLQDNVIAEWQLRYGTPIRVQKDPVNETWKIIGLDTIYAAEYLDGVDPENTEIVPLRRFEPGLLTSTTPNSMQAIVLEGVYDVGEDYYYFESQKTVNWSQAPYSDNVPAPGLCRFVLVQIDPFTGNLSYKYGDTISASLTFAQVYRFQVSTGADNFLPNKDKDKFRVGYIKLSGGMQSIDQRNNIWAAQQVLGAASTATDLAPSILGRIVTDGENVVVSDGEVVWI